MVDKLDYKNCFLDFFHELVATYKSNIEMVILYSLKASELQDEHMLYMSHSGCIRISWMTRGNMFPTCPFHIYPLINSSLSLYTVSELKKEKTEIKGSNGKMNQIQAFSREVQKQFDELELIETCINFGFYLFHSQEFSLCIYLVFVLRLNF